MSRTRKDGNGSLPRTIGACVIAGILLLRVFAGLGAEPFERESVFAPANRIDELVLADLRKKNIQPANPCSDEVFVRRIYLDVIGTLPKGSEVRSFMEDASPAKRALLIDALLAREEFADYWALKWCDLLRVKSEFPINLWPNAVQAYHRWVRDAIHDNRSYDQFARELLTSSGSNFRVPQVNFYRAVQGRSPSTIAEAAALTFMGARAEKWPQSYRTGMAAFFSRVAYKQTGEWKEEIVCLDPASTSPVKAVFPDGTSVQIPLEKDPRQVFAEWLTKPGNPWFARNAANRVWAWLMGRGIVHETDDLRQDNPPANPELLGYLEKELVDAHYDLRHLYRLILNSGTYQQSCIAKSSHPEAETLFACYPVRRLDAEPLIDALCWITETGEGYTSPIPEPFTYVPENQRSIALADGSIGSPFLEMFGRPARDTGLESERNNQPSDAQRMHLLNSSHIQRKLQQSPRLRRLVQAAKGNRPEIVRQTYLGIMSRYPTQDELATALKYFETGGLRPDQALQDLSWALINTKEFLYRH